MKTGNINVQTENIFPIIKKFLYSDHEIFLRELVSNAVDASQKLKFFSSNGEFKGEIGDLQVEVILDKKKKTITIKDNGVGMTADEIDKYINQIAFSGAEEFVKKYEGKEGAEQIIGHFGLGFYSAFMVADKVQIKTLSHSKGAKAVQWESNGDPEYTLTDIDKSDRGTEIVLHITKESKEFLEKERIEGILNKYCKFLPVSILFGTKAEYIDSPDGEKDEDEEDAVDIIVCNEDKAESGRVKKAMDAYPDALVVSSEYIKRFLSSPGDDLSAYALLETIANEKVEDALIKRRLGGPHAVSLGAEKQKKRKFLQSSAPKTKIASNKKANALPKPPMNKTTKPAATSAKKKNVPTRAVAAKRFPVEQEQTRAGRRATRALGTIN